MNSVSVARTRGCQGITSWTALIFFILTIASLNEAVAQQTMPSKDDTVAVQAVKDLIAQYAESVDKADTTLAIQIWLDSTDDSFIHPRGHEHGRDQIIKNFYGETMGANFSERKLIPRDISVHVHGDTAWSEFYWDFQAKLKKDGTPITTHGRESQIYYKEHGEWRLVHVHYSGMPVSGERRGF